MSLMYRASPLLAAALLLSSACSEDPTNLALQVDHEESYGTTEQGLVVGCGNGVVEPELGESCDDRNNAPFDGCDPLCQVESGYVCFGERPSQCSAPDRSDGPSSYGEALHNRSLPPISPFNGQEFWTGFPHNLGYPERLALKIAGASGTQGTVRSKSGTTLAAFTIPASGVSTVTVDVATYEVQSLNTVTNQGVRISANQPVRVLATSEHEYTTDTWAVWSNDKLGTDYRVLSLENAGTDHEQILVVGTAAQTSVTLMNRQGQTVESFTLDAGDTYLHRPSQPMTGFQLLSSKPIAVISGSHCEVMGSACDMTAEQLPPVRNWARDYVITPAFPGITTQSRHAVYAAFDSTAVVVTRSDGQTYNRVLAAGERWVFAGIGDARANGYFITADKPVAAATLSDDSGQNWDPSLVFWPPIDGYVTEAKMPTSGSLVAYSNFLSLITRTNATSQLRVNGSTVSGWKPIASTGYSFTIISVPQGDNEITALAGVKFGAIATGGQEYVSYGYSSPYDIAVVGGTTTTYLGDTPPDYEGPFVGGWTADTDDLQGVDDEDALVGTTSIRHGDPSPSLVIPCNDNYLGEDVNATVHGWIDFNRDGVFTQNEKASAACDDPSLATTGSATLSWSNPTYTTAGISLIRLRICDENASCDTPQGLSFSGEVEDHLVNIGGCGDAFTDTFEGCDDGNTADGDGCSATCTVEPDFSCSGSPSVCLIENAPTILLPTSGTLTNQEQQDVSGSCAEGSSVRVWDGPVLACTAACVDSSFSCTAAGLGDGEHELRADQSYGGLTSTRSAATTLYVDSLAPDAPALGAPVDGAFIASRRPVFSGSCEPGAEVQVRRQSDVVVCVASCSLEGTFSCTPSFDLSDATYPFQLLQTDVGGRFSPLSPVSQITIDTAAPSAPAISAPANGATLGSAQVTISGSCEANASVTVYEGLATLCTTSCNAGAFSCNALLANGAHAIAARQRDRADNASPFSALRSFSVLAPPPAPTILAPDAGALVNRSVITVSCLAGNTVSITDGTTQLCTGLCPASSFTCQPALPDGIHTVFASQTDTTPATSPQSQPRFFTLDTIAPLAPTLAQPGDGWVTVNGTVAFTGSCSDDATVQVLNGPATLCYSFCAGGSFACTSAELSPGVYQVAVRQRDAAGNVSPDSGMSSFAVLGPVALNTPAEGALTGPNPIASGSCQTGSTIEVQSNFSGPCQSACVDGFFSCELGPLSDGNHTIVAIPKDELGSFGPMGPLRNFFVDGTPPIAPTLSTPAADAYLSNPSPHFIGNCESGALVEVLDGSDLLCSTTCVDLSFSCLPASPLADGTWTATVQQTDLAGNLGPSLARTFYVDTVAPSAPILDIDYSHTNSSTPPISGSCEDEATVQVFVGMAPTCTAVCADSTFSCNASPLGDGLQMVHAQQTDRAGNQSSASTPRSFFVDTVPPLAPTPAAPAPDSVLATSTPTFTGACEPDATVTIYEGANVLCSSACVDSAYACTSVALVDGTHAYFTAQQDLAGNVGGMSAVITFVVDTTPPVAPVILAPAADAFVSDSTPAISGTCETGAAVEVFEGAALLCAASCASSAFSCDTISLGDGEHLVFARQTDVAGNVGPASGTRAFIVDTAAPAAPAIAAPAAGVFLSDTTPIVSGSCEDHAAVEILEGVDLLCTATCASSTFSCETTTLAEGLRTLTARQRDRAGNLGAASATRSFTVDTTAPAAPTVTSPAEGRFVSDATPTVSGTCESDASVRVYQGSTLLCSATCAASAYSCDATTLGDGEHAIFAAQTDRAGNESPAGAQRTFTVDTVAPAAPIVSQPAAGAFLSDTTPIVAGSCETHASIMVLEGSTFLCTAICVDAAFQCESSTLTQGTHLVSVRQSDRAGNQSEASAPLSFTVDTLAPAAPSISAPAADAFLSDATPTVSGSCENHATLEVLEGADVICSATCTNGEFSCDTSSLGDGAHLISVRQIDRAGNTSSTSAPRSFTVDTVAPAAPILLEPAAGIWLSDETPTFAGSCESHATVEVFGGSGLLCSATCADDAFRCDAAMADGSHAITLTQTDRAGNLSVTSAPVSFNVDTLDPASPTITAPTNGAAFSNSTPTVSGSCETEAIVEVLEGSTVLCSATCIGGAFSCTTSLLSEGGHVIGAAQTDRAGNRSDLGGTISFTVDTVPPAPATLDAPARGELLADARPSFEGTAEPHSTVSVRSDGVQICSATTAADGSWSCVSEIDLADGRRSIEVRVRDTVGNETASERVSPILLDTKAPQSPSLLVPASGQVVSGWTTFIGLAEPGATVLVVVDGQVICSAIADKGGRYACLSSEELAGGPHSVSVFASDDAGNESAPSRAVDFSVSPDAPPSQAVIENPLYEGSNPTGSNPMYEGLAEPGSNVSVQVNGVEVCVVKASPTGAFSCSPTHSLPDGDHVVTAVVTNANGRSQPSLPTPFTIDRIPPQAPSLTHPASGEGVGTMPALVGTTEPGAQVRILVDDVEICTTTADAAGGFACMPEAPLAPGSHSISIEATDLAGNTSTTTSSFTAINGQAPDAILGQPVGGTASGDSTVTFAGKAVPGSTVEVSADGSVLCTAVALPSGDWTCTADLDDGAHSVEVRATNEDGSGTSHARTELVVDTTPPAAPTLLAPTGDEPTSSRPTFLGTAEPLSQVQIYLDGQLVCVTEASETGAFECTLPTPLAIGAHSVDVVAIDAAGNASDASAAVDFLTSPVALSLDEPSIDLPLANSTPTFAGKAEPGDLVSVIVDGEVACQAEADPNGDWSCTPAQPLAEGARTVSVSSDNGYGTVRTTSDESYVIDTVAPSAPTLDTPQPGEDLLGSATTFAGTAEPGATVRVLVDGAVVCTAVAASDGSWSCDADLEGGAHDVSVSATDLAGNTSTASGTVSFLKTTELSAPVFTSPAPAAYLTSTEVLFAGTAIPETTVTVYAEDGAALCSALTDEDGSFTCTGVALRGKNTVHAVSTWQDLESPASAETSFTVAGAGRFEGGGCASSSGGASAWGFLALGLLLLGTRRKR